MDSATDKIRFACDCGARIGVPPAAAGKRVRCPKCQTAVRVPQPDDAQTEHRPDHSDHSSTAERASAIPARAPEAGLVESLESLMDGETLRLAPEPPPAAPIAPAKPKGAGGRGPGAARLHLFDGSLDDDAPDGPPVACPCCEKEYRTGVKICVECGIDIKTGRAIQTRDDSTLDRTYEVMEPTLEWISYLVPFGYFPVASEAFGLRRPWVIRAIAVITVIISGWYMQAYLWPEDPPQALGLLMQWSGRGGASPEEIAEQVQEMRDSGVDETLIAEIAAEMGTAPDGMGFRWYQPLTAAFLHADFMHLIGNLIFLLVFGARVNALIGNGLSLLAYPFLAYSAGIAWDISQNGRPMGAMLGGSGAIMGLAGMYLVLMPVANVHMAGWLRLFWWWEAWVKLWAVRGFWVVLFWIGWDVFYTYLGMETGTAHWAHLGGFIGGVSLALVLLLTRLVNARGGDVLSTLCGRAAWGLIGKPNRPPRTLW
ncbi:MAG: rhomboid family intramembrane serine protease [Phycisphaerae bacterium]|nr:rhomboid family intramembrane serine protease [Phycisphaerae bacterium]